MCAPSSLVTAKHWKNTVHARLLLVVVVVVFVGGGCFCCFLLLLLVVMVVADFVVGDGGKRSCWCFCCSCFVVLVFVVLVFVVLVFVVVLVGGGGGGGCVVSLPFFSGDHQALEEHRPCKVTLLTLNAVIMLMIQDARS